MWFDDVLDAKAQPLVEALLVLLANGQRWRHRRVETLTPVSAAFVRRRISIDFTVPDELHAGLRLTGTGAHGQWLVPLGWLARRQLVNFDLRSTADEPVPLLLGQETARLTEDLLVLAAVRAGLDARDAEAVDEATRIIERAADERPVEDVESLERGAHALGLDEQFASLVGASARGFLLLAVLPQVAGRQVVKVQSDEHHREATFTLSADLPGINEAASTHVELELPDVLRATRFELWDARRTEPVEHRRLAAGERRHMESRERPRLLLAPVAGAQQPYVRASLVVSLSEFLAPALVMALLAVAILVIGLATGIAHRASGDQGSAAATILLAAVAALSGLVLRVEEHPLVRAILARPRAALGATGLGVFVAAVPIGLQLGHGWILASWWAALVVCVLAAGVLWAAIIEHTDWGRSAV
jgi:hypothetical protein